MRETDTSKPKRINLRANINRLVIVAALLLLLKLFAYVVTEFLPVFSHVVGQLVSALLPFIIAFIIAFLIEPLVSYLMKRLKIKRTYSSLLVITLVVIVFSLLLILLGGRLYRELVEMTAAFPQLYDKTLNLFFEKLFILERYIQLNPEIQNALRSSTQDIIASVQVIIKKGSLGVLAFLGALPGFMLITVVTTIATLLTSMSFPQVKEWFFARMKGKYNEKSRLVAADLGTALIGFLRAQTILVSVTIIVITVGLLLIGNKYAFTVGIVAGLLDLVPIIGPSLIFIPWTIILLFAADLASALQVFIIYIVATIIRQMLEPKIMSQNIGIHPLPTLISIYVGLKLFGALGLILGPTLIIVYAAFRKAGVLRRS